MFLSHFNIFRSPKILILVVNPLIKTLSTAADLFRTNNRNGSSNLEERKYVSNIWTDIV